MEIQVLDSFYISRSFSQYVCVYAMVDRWR